VANNVGSFDMAYMAPRNRLIFANEEFDGHQVMEEVIYFCWLWLKNMEKDFEAPYHVWTSHTKAELLCGGG